MIFSSKLLLTTALLLAAQPSAAFQAQPFKAPAFRNSLSTASTRLSAAYIQDTAGTVNPGSKEVVLESSSLVEESALVGDATTAIPGEEDELAKARKGIENTAPFNLWKKRLNTAEDRKWFHKLSSIAFVLSSTVVVGEGFNCGFQEFPDWMGPFDFILFLSTMLMSVSSIGMANSHRRSDKVSRDFFHTTSLTQISTAAVSQIFTPYEHSHLFVANKFLLDLNVGVPLVFLGAYLINAIYHQRDLISTRLNVEESTALDYLKTFSIYLASPLVFIGVVWYYAFQVLDPSHDVASLIQAACDTNSIGMTYYTQEMSLIGVGYIAFAITLHDKKLISTRIESTIIGILSAIVTAGNVALLV